MSNAKKAFIVSMADASSLTTLASIWNVLKVSGVLKENAKSSFVDLRKLYALLLVSVIKKESAMMLFKNNASLQKLAKQHVDSILGTINIMII